MTRILAVSSGGGHWQQLQLLAAAMEGVEVIYACSGEPTSETVQRLPDCNLRTPRRALATAVAVWRLTRRVKPDIVVSTGAAPGALAIVAAKMLGCRTIWVDSIANAQRMSLSGRIIRRFADLWMTQWPSVADRTGAVFVGAVL